MINVILCGGSGTRLWPISRTKMPKQFTQLVGKYSLFQDTVIRNNKITNKYLIVCNEEHYFMALDQIEEIKSILNKDLEFEFILESVGRNTAAAIIISSLHVKDDDILFVTPSDHSINNIHNYIKSVEKAESFAKEDFIALFGIVPTSPHTGYGYIEAKNENVKSFHEKPNLEIAESFFESSDHYWNSGMFCFKASTILNSAKKHALDIHKNSKAAYNNSKNKDVIRINKQEMESIPSQSFDIAVLEKSNNLKVVKSNLEWSDLGSFGEIYKFLEKDENDNAIKYTGSKPTIIDSNNNLVITNNKKLALVNVENIAVINTADALLIINKDETQKVKEVVSEIMKDDENLTIEHPLAHRPWGTYDVMDNNEKYKLKKIVVKPTKRLSLQKHFHRNEHWIVLSGTATVTIGKTKKLVRANESVYIPMGKKHRLENEGKIDLELIEIQVGEYLEEDDIVRYKDDFKRI